MLLAFMYIAIECVATVVLCNIRYSWGTLLENASALSMAYVLDFHYCVNVEYPRVFVFFVISL